MIRLATIKIEIPEIKKVEVPTSYWTPIGSVKRIEHVNAIKQLIEYLQRIDDIEFIINADHQHVRHPYCRELVRDRLRFIDNSHIWHYGEALSHFLMGFRRLSGLNFKDYEFESRVESNGVAYRFEKFTRLFDTEDEAIQYYIQLAISNRDDLLSLTIEEKK